MEALLKSSLSAFSLSTSMLPVDEPIKIFMPGTVEGSAFITSPSVMTLGILAFRAVDAARDLIQLHTSYDFYRFLPSLFGRY